MARLRKTEKHKVHLRWTHREVYCGKVIPEKSKYSTEDKNSVTCGTCKKANGPWSLKRKPEESQ